MARHHKNHFVTELGDNYADANGVLLPPGQYVIDIKKKRDPKLVVPCNCCGTDLRNIFGGGTFVGRNCPHRNCPPMRYVQPPAVSQPIPLKVSATLQDGVISLSVTLPS
jgi:hypothetical protein